MTQLPVLSSPATDPEWLTTTGTFKHVELEINTACDLACFGCDRMSDVASKGVPNMTLDQVRLFVRESLDLRWEWERIRVLGGEPTIHPRFKDIVEVVMTYRDAFPNVFIQVLSNGQGKYEEVRDWCLERGVNIHTEYKSPGVQPEWFNNTRITPVDRDPSVGELPPCAIFGVHGCGIGLTRHGYFLDGAGASIARVAGHDVGKMHLREVTQEAMLDQARVLCRICGHWNPLNASLDNEFRVSRLVTETGQVTGGFWTETLARYNERKPVLRIYGE